MKPSVNEKLDDVLGIAIIPEMDLVSHESTELVCSGDSDQDMLADFNVSRSTLYTLIDRSTELVENANHFAIERQDARSIEAAAMAQKEARDTAMALLSLHKTRTDIEKTSVPKNTGDTNITQNAVFVGTTGDLLKLTKEMNAGVLKNALKTIDVTELKK